MGDDIPADIWKAAQVAVSGLLKPTFSQLETIDRAARAILAERRRCAGLALPRIHHRHQFHLRKAIHDQIMKGDAV